MLSSFFTVNSPDVKVLDFFLDLPEMAYSLRAIARNSRISQRKAKEVVDKLVKFKILERREIDDTAYPVYLINESSEILRTLHKFDFQVAKIVNNEILESEKK